MKLQTLIALSITLSASTFLFAQSDPEDRAVVLSYMTDTAPVIDGMIDDDEWDAAGPWLVATGEDPSFNVTTDRIEGDTWGGDEDLSYRFKTMWQEDTANFFILYEVFDDIAMSDDPTRLWERDHVETFFDGTNLDGDDDTESFHWWDNVETYGKIGVSRYNTFEGNVGKMTDDPDIWDDGFGSNIISLSAVEEMGTNADYRVELAVSLIPMIDDGEFFPFDGTPTDEEGTIVADSTQIKYLVNVGDDDNFENDDTELSNGLTYFRVEDTVWDQSTGFGDLLFTGEWDGELPVVDVAGDCNGDGDVTTADLSCGTNAAIDDTLSALGILSGDFDGNGKVEFADFLVLSNNFGQDGKTYAEGNADAVGKVEFADFLLMSNNFGQSVAAASVPEPSTFSLFGISCLLVGLVRRKRS